MNVYQVSENIEDGLPVVVASVVKQANNESDNLPIELTNITGTYLQHLNEDCLLEIFSVKSLTLMDLCSLADSCTRFQKIAQRVFPKDLRFEMSWKSYGVTSRKHLLSKILTLQDIKRIFENFGLCLSEVSITNSSYYRETLFVLNLVTEFCVDELESLRIKRMEIPAVLTVKLKPILKRLQLLDLYNVSILGDDSILFVNLDSLIELGVCLVENDSAILKNIFPSLERFSYRGGQLLFEIPLLIFISRHRSLKRLVLEIRTDEMFKIKFLQVVANSCKDLEELELDLGYTNSSSLQPLLALQSLKVLKLEEVECEDLKFIAALTNLRELHLDDCYLPEDSTQFNFLFQLTKLVLKESIRSGSFDVVGLVRRLTNLEELTVDKEDYYEIDEETFSKIVDVVKGRANVLTLKCNINFALNLDSCNENPQVKVIRYSTQLIDRFVPGILLWK